MRRLQLGNSIIIEQITLCKQLPLHIVYKWGNMDYINEGLLGP